MRKAKTINTNCRIPYGGLNLSYAIRVFRLRWSPTGLSLAQGFRYAQKFSDDFYTYEFYKWREKNEKQIILF